MTVTLPPELPAWQVRRPTSDDLDALHRLAHDLDLALLGVSDITRADVAADLASTTAAAERNQLVVLDGDRMLAWIWVEDRAVQRISIDLFVDRSLPADLLDRLGGWGWRWAVERGWQIAADHGWGSTQLEVGVLAADTLAGPWLTDLGFTHARTFWRMGRSVAADDSWPRSPGVVVRMARGDESALVHEVYEEAFADHWNHAHQPFDVWWGHQQESAGFDPSLWWLAEVDGEPVGVLIGSSVSGDDGALYVPTLGVRRARRGRGVAKALLYNAFAHAPQRGWHRVTLTVDGESPTGATALYRSVGMDVEFEISNWLMTVEPS